jgi:hypothetical protein
MWRGFRFVNKNSSPSPEGVLGASLDQCYVEQKNGQIVRQVVGYDRFVGEFAYRQLTELYRGLRVYVNCFQPSMKLQTKQREESRSAAHL